MQKQNKLAFTLVELIVVITILAILATIAFISLQGYGSNSRDSKRLSDLGNMKKVLELYSLKNGHYPNPDNVTNINYSGSIAWYLGEFGEEVRRAVERINPSPKDPLTDTYYAYGLTNNRQEYELATILENANNASLNIISQANANSEGYTAYVSGNYNKKILSVRTGNTIKILGVPTLITTDPSVTELDSITETQRRSLFSINNKTNLPGNIIEKINTGILGEGFVATAEEIYENGAITNTDINNGATSILLYEGTIEDLSNDTIKAKVGENIKSYYTGTESTLGNIYQDIASEDGIVILDALISNRQGGLNSKDVSLSSNTSGGSTGGGESILCNYGEIVVSGECSDPYWNDVTLLVRSNGNNSENNGSIYDSSSINNLINKNGDVKQDFLSPFTSVGGSIYFDGVGDYLSTTYSPSNFDWWTSDFTLEMYVYGTDWSKWGYYDGGYMHSLAIGNGQATGLSSYWSFGPIPNGSVQFRYWTGSSNSIVSVEKLNLNEWNHIAMTKTSAGIQIYINGVGLSNPIAINGTPLSNSTSGNMLLLGAINNTFLNGNISNVRIVKGTSLYNSNFIPSINLLSNVSNTKFLLVPDKPKILDYSIDKNLIATRGNTQINSTISKFNLGSISSSNNAHNILTIGHNDKFNFGIEDFTIEGWLYPTQNTAGGIYSKRDSSAGEYTAINIQQESGSSAPRIRFLLSTNGTTWNVDYTSSMEISLNNWHHFSLVRDGANINLYIDGIKNVVSSNFTSSLMSNTKNISLLGSSLGVGNNYMEYQGYNGYLSEFRITKGISRYSENFTPHLYKFPIK